MFWYLRRKDARILIIIAAASVSSGYCQIPHPIQVIEKKMQERWEQFFYNPFSPNCSLTCRDISPLLSNIFFLQIRLFAVKMNRLPSASPFLNVSMWPATFTRIRPTWASTGDSTVRKVKKVKAITEMRQRFSQKKEKHKVQKEKSKDLFATISL